MKAQLCALIIGTLTSTAVLAAPITFKEKVGGAYNYTQYIETKMMTDAIGQELAALNTMYETGMFEETPFGDTAARSSTGGYRVDGLILDPGVDNSVAGLILDSDTGFDETPFGDTATSGPAKTAK